MESTWPGLNEKEIAMMLASHAGRKLISVERRMLRGERGERKREKEWGRERH